MDAMFAQSKFIEQGDQEVKRKTKNILLSLLLAS
jgi:hypothetical protein